MRKKLLSLALALVMCLGLFPLAASAAGTQKVVEDETHGVKITLNGFLREETRRYNRMLTYDWDTGELLGGRTDAFTIYVVADDSTVTVEALEGRKYADPRFVEALKDHNRHMGFMGDTPEYEAYKTFFQNDMQSYAFESTYFYDWDSETNCFQDFGALPWPLEKSVTYTASPTMDGEYKTCSINAGFGVLWLCESDYAKLIPATMQASDWAQAEVERAWDAELMPFSPYLADCTRSMTREGFAAVTVRLYAAMIGKAGYWPDASEEHPFTDVDWETTNYESEIGMAYNLGFVQGSNAAGTLFNPKGTLTRQEAAVMLARVYAKVHGDIPTVTATAFADDASIAGWAKSAVAFMADKGIMGGTGSNTFAPQKTLSIQEAVIMANRMLESLK